MNFWNFNNLRIAYSVLNGKSCKEVADQWGISTRRVNQIANGIFLLAGNRSGLAISSTQDVKDNYHVIAEILEKESSRFILNDPLILKFINETAENLAKKLD